MKSLFFFLLVSIPLLFGDGPAPELIRNSKSCLELRKPLAGDYNNDGFTDIAYYGKCGNGSVDCWRVHLNNQNGGFTTTSYGGEMWFKGSGAIHAPVSGDFNKDGYDDIAYYGKCGNSGADCWRVHINDRNGSFNARSYGGGMWFKGSAPIHAPVSGDFNFDGYADIAYYGRCGNGGADCWRVHLNNQNGGFTTHGFGGSMWFKGAAPIHAPISGDFNNDNYDDIAYYGRCGNGGGDCFRVHINNQNKGFTARSYGGGNWFKSSSWKDAPVSGDFNNDGFDDIAYYGRCGNGGADCWRVHLNNQNGVFTTHSFGSDMWFKASNGQSRPVSGRLNNDDIDDLVYFGRCGNGGADCWRAHLGQPNRSFSTKGFGGDMWFGDCNQYECKSVSITGDNVRERSARRAKREARRSWENKVRNDCGGTWADWKKAKDSDIRASSQNGWHSQYNYGKPCRKSPSW